MQKHHSTTPKPSKISYILAGLLLFSTFITTSCITANNPRQNKEESLLRSELNIISTKLNQGRPEAALQSLNPVLIKFPEHYDVLTIAGMTHLALNNDQQAASFLRKAYNIRPTIASGLNLSSVLIHSGSYLKARNVLRKLLKRTDEKYAHPERLYHNLGLAYEKSNKRTSAVKQYKKALSINPTYYMSLIQLAKIYRKARRTKASKKYLKKATKACTTCFEAVHLLATDYINANNPRSAQKILKIFLRSKDIHPEDKVSAQSLLAITQKYAQATPKAQTSQKILPTSKKKISRTSNKYLNR